MDKIKEELSATNEFNRDFYKNKFFPKDPNYFYINILNRVTKSKKIKSLFPN